MSLANHFLPGEISKRRRHFCDNAAQNTTINNKMNKAESAIPAFLAGLNPESGS
jgi:hypothetical protein